MECPPVKDAPTTADAAHEAAKERGPDACLGRSIARLFLLFV
jgi:hypothetical protein